METFTVPTSTNVRTVTYNDQDNSMSVTFFNGRSYRYTEVPYDHFLAMLNAAETGESVGALFRSLIVSGGFEFEEVMA